MASKKLSRRDFLRSATLGGVGLALAAAGCQPKTVVVEKQVEKEVTRVIKETVKETVVVEGTPKVVEKEVTKVVKETVVVQATAAPVPEAVVVRDLVWGAWEGGLDMYDMFAHAFHERNPYITVEYLFVPAAEFHTKIKTMEAAGDPPEVVMPLGGGLNYHRGVDFSIWLDLKPYIDQDSYDMSEFSENSIKSVMHPFSGAIEGLPVQVFTSYLIYNKTMFQEAGLPEPPHSWEDESWTPEVFLETCIKLTRDANGKHPGEAGFDAENIVQYGTNQEWDLEWWGYVFGGYGVRFNPDDRRTAPIADQAFVEGVQFYQDMIYKHHVSPNPIMRQNMVGMLPSVFNTGKIGMQSGWPWEIHSYEGSEGFEYDFAANVYGPKAKHHYAGLCLDEGLITQKSKNHDASWEWIKYMNTPEMSVAWAVGLRECLPARLSLVSAYAERMSARTPGIDFQVLPDALPYAAYTEYWAPPTGWEELWNPVVDQINAGERPAAEALEEVAPILQENWDDYYAQFK